MKTLVTGGSGVVGRAVVRQLAAAGREVRGLARSEEAAAVLAGLGAAPAAGDILDPDSLARAAAGCEAVYHIAGRVSFCPKDPARLYEVNVEGTRNVVRAARRAGARRLVYTSSVAALGEKPGTVGSESNRGGHHLSCYGRSKHLGEQTAFAEAEDMEVVAVNPSSVQGGGRSAGSGGLLLRAVNGRLRVMVDAPISMVDVEDCARGHLAAEQRGIPGQCYVLSGFTITARSAAALMGDLTGRRYQIRFIPAPALAALAPFSGLIGRFVRSAPVCAETVRTMRYGASYDGSRAAWELGLEYRTARETFAGVIEAFRAAGLTEA